MKLEICARAMLVFGLALRLGGINYADARDIVCPTRCTDLFGRLKEGAQKVEVELRGEPKSGTRTSTRLAKDDVAFTCTYLQNLYGERSCHTEGFDGEGSRRLMIFEPEFDENAPCTCDEVKRVEISFSSGVKHSLPVTGECAYTHTPGVWIPRNETHTPCQRRKGLEVQNQFDLSLCVDEAGCTFNDERLQLAMMRDPRAVTVSTYFYIALHHPAQLEVLGDAGKSVDAFFQRMLQPMCAWTSIRYQLFTQLLADQSQVFWMEDMLVDPIDFHGRFSYFVGLRLPISVIMEMEQASASDGSKGIDEHPGGGPRVASRTFRDELGPESLAMMDDVARSWLLPVLLKRFGIIE